MNLYILRHGKAARPDPDEPRSLTAQGREEVACMAGYFKKKNLKISRLWHSSKTRAIQTAEVFLEVVGKKDIQVEEKKELKPEGDVQAVFEEIAALKDGSLLVVSHLPLVGELATLLAEDSPEAEIAFPTGGVAAFERTGKTWKWIWSLDPSTLK